MKPKFEPTKIRSTSKKFSEKLRKNFNEKP